MPGFLKLLASLVMVVLASSGPPLRLLAQESGEPVVASDPDPPVLEEVAPPEVRKQPEAEGEPWLGVRVVKAPQSVYAQLPDIPKGVGFIVESVTEGGPADAAGLQRYDFLWKLNDQLLINESQMLVLLNVHKVGETVKLTLQRQGQEREVQAVLVARPDNEKGRDAADRVAMSPPVPGLPMQIVNLGRRVAEIRDGEGVVKIERAGDEFGWEQRDPDGKLIQQGQIPGADELPEKLDPVLAGKLRALVRTFEHAEQRAASGPRHRVRRVLVEDKARP